MKEENKDTQSEVTTTEDSKEEESGVGDGKVFTQEKLDEIIQTRIERERTKLAGEMEDKLKKATEEAERMAQLSADEREKELREKQQLELEEKERVLQLRENKLEAIDMLSKEGLPITMVDLIVDVDKEQMLTNIGNLTKSWQESVESTVEERLKGKSPKDVKTANNGNKTPTIKTVL